MKNLIYIILASVILASCSSSKEARTTKIELKKEKMLADEAALREAIETRQFIVKFDRLHIRHGGWAMLRPKANYLIIDGKRAIISSAYIGRSYSALPIEGIRLQGEYADYEVIHNTSKGIYEIKLTVTRGGDTLDIFLTVGRNGQSTTSFSGIKIDYVSYSGNAVPIIERKFSDNLDTSTI